MNFTIRQLEEADLEEGRGLFQTLSNLSDVDGLTTNIRKDVFKRASGEGVYFFVAVSEEDMSKGQIISTVKLIIEPKFFHGGKAAGHIEDVATRAGFEGNGLAKALLKEAIKVAEENNCYKIILDCKKELIPFYNKLGFESHDVCMRLDLKK